METYKRDRAGEPFQNDFTTNEDADPGHREPESHDLGTTAGKVEPETNSGEHPDFAKELRGTDVNKPPEP